MSTREFLDVYVWNYDDDDVVGFADGWGKVKVYIIIICASSARRVLSDVPFG